MEKQYKWVRWNFIVQGVGLVLSYQTAPVQAKILLSVVYGMQDKYEELFKYLVDSNPHWELPLMINQKGNFDEVLETQYTLSGEVWARYAGRKRFGLPNVNFQSATHSQLLQLLTESENEMTTAINEDIQTVQQILGALQQDKLQVVTVKFPDNQKEYFYKTTDTSIEVGNHVVIDSPYSGIISLEVLAVAPARVTGISNQLLGSLKWIIQKVDFYNYLTSKEAEQKVKEDLLKSIEAKRAQDVLEYARQTFGAGVNAVLDVYVGSLSTTPVLEAPVKKVTKRVRKVKE